MNKVRLARLQEIAKSKGKELFLEEFTISSEQVSIDNSNRIVESYDTSKFTSKGIVRNIPISVYGLNRNNRKYPRELFQNLLRKGMFNRANCLANHSGSGKDGEHGPASVLNVCGVWHNLRADEDFPRADLYTVGDAGQLMMDILNAGGKIAFSLNGFGTLLEDGITVDPNTYESADEESSCDWVFTPSAGMAASATKEENLDIEKEVPDMDTILESTKEIQKESVESKTNKTVTPAVTETAIMENTKMSEENKLVESESVKLQERHLKHQVELTVREAYKSQNLSEALEDLSQAEKLISDRPALTETLNKVLKAQGDLKEKLEKQLSDKDKALKEAKTSIDTVSAEHARLKEAHASLESKYATAKTVINNLKEKLDSGKGKIKEISKDKVTVFKKVFTDMLQDNTIFREERKKFLATIKRMKEEAGEEWEEPEDGMPYLGENEDEVSDLEVEDIGLGDEDEIMEDMDSDEAAFGGEVSDDEDEEMFEEDMSFDARAAEESDEHSMSEEDDEFGAEGELAPGEEEVEPYAFDEEDEDEENEIEDDESEKIIESARRKLALLAKKEALKKKAVAFKPKTFVKKTVKETVKPLEVVHFYKEAVKVNRSVANIREQVLACKSVAEAYRKVNEYVNSKGEYRKNLSVKESTKFEKPGLINSAKMW